MKVKIPGVRKICGLSNKFEWNNSLQHKFDTMKNYLKSTEKLSPFDFDREIHLHMDVSNSGIGFKLSQPKDKYNDDTSDNYRTQRNKVTHV